MLSLFSARQNAEGFPLMAAVYLAPAKMYFADRDKSGAWLSESPDQLPDRYP